MPAHGARPRRLATTSSMYARRLSRSPGAQHHEPHGGDRIAGGPGVRYSTPSGLRRACFSSSMGSSSVSENGSNSSRRGSSRRRSRNRRSWRVMQPAVLLQLDPACSSFAGRSRAQSSLHARSAAHFDLLLPHAIEPLTRPSVVADAFVGAGAASSTAPILEIGCSLTGSSWHTCPQVCASPRSGSKTLPRRTPALARHRRTMAVGSRRRGGKAQRKV